MSCTYPYRLARSLFDWLVFAVVIVSVPAYANETVADSPIDEPPALPAQDTPDDIAFDTLADLDITALMDIEVISVSGEMDSWFTTPAALTVITPEDIERSGFQMLPEVFRLVPGLQVGRVNASQWAIGVRGFNGLFADKLQVSIDGRSAYNQDFGGVNWDEVDYILQDLEQIEVIRGPGATLWGTNAVNGVINIRSKNAKDTQGWLVTGGVGTELRTLGQVRYGGQLSDDAYFRVWSKYINHDSSITAAGTERPDDFDSFRAGFRADGAADETAWTLQGDLFHSNRLGSASLVPQPTGHLATALVIGDTEALNANLLGRIRVENADGDWAELQGYYETRRRTSLTELISQSHTLNTEFRRHMTLGRHSVLFGIGYRFDTTRSDNGPTLSFIPADTEFHEFRGFLQDTIQFEDDRWSLIVGSKFEYNDFTGFEFQPSARLSFSPDPSLMVWGAFSRPVNRPNRDINVNLVLAFVDTGLLGGGPASGIIIPSTFSGNPDPEATEVYAAEMGVRKQFNENLQFDVSTYFNTYVGEELIPAGVLSPVSTNSTGSANTWGVEAVMRWDPTEQLSIHASYSYYGFNFRRAAGFLENTFANFPHHMAQMRTSYDLTEDLNTNLNIYYVDDSDTLGGEAYIRLDLGLVWNIDHQTKLSIWGQNLLEDSHVEAVDSFQNDQPSAVQRGVVVTLTKEF